MFKFKLFKAYMLVRLDLGFQKEARKLEIDYRALNYYRRKYKRFLKGLPSYKGSGKCCDTVWWCWLQGEEKAPELNRACLNSLRQNLKNKKIVVVTKDNYGDYASFPSYIIRKYEKGLISNAHFADLLRLQLLIKYGGTWIDSSVLCTGYNPYYFNKSLFVFSNFMRADRASRLSNWFITAESNNPILCTTRDLLFEYWKKHSYAQHYFIFHLFFTLACEKYNNLWKKVPIVSNVPPHIMQFELADKYNADRFNYIKNSSSIHKLSQKIVVRNKENTVYQHIIDTYGKGKNDR